ncbi:hypothetical protein ACC676_38345, partial [Rhizobium ruizarguesonis]
MAADDLAEAFCHSSTSHVGTNEMMLDQRSRMQFGIEVELNVGHFYHFLVASGMSHSTQLHRWS